MSLVDYPLFSWVVVIHFLHISSFLEAHHQEIILPVQSAFWYIVFAVALPFSYVFCRTLRLCANWYRICTGWCATEFTKIDMSNTKVITAKLGLLQLN